MLSRISVIIVIFYSLIIGQGKQLTVDEIYTNSKLYSPMISRVLWFSEGEKFSFMKPEKEKGVMSIFQHDVKTGEEALLVSGADLISPGSDEQITIHNYAWSPNEKFILFTGVLPARSLKTGGTFYIYDIEQKKITIEIDSEEEQVSAQFSPDGNKIGFVRGNNLFIYDITNGKEVQLTFDGSETILNGVFDWVYEEEFSIINAWEWSPDSRHIAYWQLDQSPVPEVMIAKWDSLYFNFHTMRYPKAGAENAFVKIGVVNIDYPKTAWMDIGKEKDIYVSRIKFTADPDVLSIQRLNRLQNQKDFMLADIKTGSTKTILTETSDTWVDPESDDLTFLNDDKHFIWSSDLEGFKHFYFYDMEGNLVNKITSGEWEIDALKAVDEENKTIYYTSSERGSLYRDLYSIKFDGSNKKRITNEAGTHTINAAPKGNYFINSYSNANRLSKIFLIDNDGSSLRTLAEKDTDVLTEYGLAPMEFMQFTTTDGVELNAAMIKPSDFDPSKKYPVLIYNYSGPGSQVVKDAYGSINYLWHQMLAQKGYIIFMLDNRGTGHRGKAFRDVIYKQLGKWEVNDMIEGAKYLSSLDYIDGERIGIWGWSYGGYMSALALMQGAEHFKAAVSVAPVTHWKFYDTIYTERYMQTPQLNPEGYEDGSPLNHVEKIKGKLLLVHGTGDDNVHFQNTVALVTEMIDKNIPFETMFYPERMHGISGGMTRRHLYTMMTKFILDEL